jgi:hypothetical protein
MRRTVQLLFLLFYIASSYAIGQERTAVIASAVLQSGYSEDHLARCRSGKQLDPSWPNYHEAKPKTICASEVGQHQAIHFRAPVAERVVPPTSQSEKSLFSLENTLDRAPPANG